MSRLLKIVRLFGRISSLLQVSFAKETYNFKELTNRSHPIIIVYSSVYKSLEIYLYLYGEHISHVCVCKHAARMCVQACSTCVCASMQHVCVCKHAAQYSFCASRDIPIPLLSSPRTSSNKSWDFFFVFLLFGWKLPEFSIIPTRPSLAFSYRTLFFVLCVLKRSVFLVGGDWRLGGSALWCIWLFSSRTLFFLWPSPLTLYFLSPFPVPLQVFISLPPPPTS